MVVTRRSLRREGAVKKATLPGEVRDERCALSCPYSGNGDRNRHPPYRGPAASPLVRFSGPGRGVHPNVPAAGNGVQAGPVGTRKLAREERQDTAATCCQNESPENVLGQNWA